MDSELLRWTLLLIGTVLILAVYLYGRHQIKLRNRQAIETYTQQELDDLYIDDTTLRDELKQINSTLTDNSEADFGDININPGMEAECSDDINEQQFIDDNCQPSHHLVSYLLKRSDGKKLSTQHVHDVLLNNNFLTERNHEYIYFNHAQEVFSVALRSEEIDLNKNQVSALCFFMDKIVHRKNADKNYEIMLKVIDSLTQLLNVKVYNQNQTLLTIDDVTFIRKKLLNLND